MMFNRRRTLTFRLLPGAAALALLLTGCASLLPAAAPGDVLFQDEFNYTSSGWDRYADETYEARYVSGVYRIQVFTNQTMVWSLPGVKLQDVQIAVDAGAIEGTPNNLFGTICRYINADNFVFFLVSSDGFAGIGRYRDGERQLLTDRSLLPTDAIPDDRSPLHLTSTCSGRTLRLAINGREVAAAETELAGAGDVGLLAGTYDAGGVTIEFDNFSVTQP